MPRDPSPPPKDRRSTPRQELLARLGEGTFSARELSAAVGLPEKDVYAHLTHLRKSLRRSPRRLQVTPPACRKCGFVFEKRSRLTRPSRCPVCRGESISEALFSLA